MNTRLSILALIGAIVLFAASVAFFVKAKHRAAQPAATAVPTPSEATSSNTVAPPAPASASTPAKDTAVVRTRMHNVLFHLTNTVAPHIQDLTGELRPTPGHEMPVFDDSASFDVFVSTATISMTPTALSDIMNNIAFAAPNAPLKNISISIENGRLRVKGKLHSKGDLPFETLGTPTANADGRLRIHTEKVKALKIPVKGMMSVFGIELANVVNTSKIEGIDTDKDDLLIDLSTFLPPPHLHAKVKTVTVTNDSIVTVISGPAPLADLPALSGNYMEFIGGRLRFGKLTMTDSDLAVADLDPNDPLDWNQSRYQSQLLAGYSRITPAFGLLAYVKDYSKIKDQKPATPAQP